MLINLESVTTEYSSALERFSYHPTSLSLTKVILASLTPITEEHTNSWTAYHSLHLNSSTTSHIHPKRKYQLKLSLHVLSAFVFTVFPVASLLSVKRVSLSSQLPRHILEVNCFQTLAGSQLLSSADYALAYYSTLN